MGLFEFIVTLVVMALNTFNLGRVGPFGESGRAIFLPTLGCFVLAVLIFVEFYRISEKVSP